MNKRQQIVNAIVNRLKTIKTDAGYNSNLGSNVFEWRTTTVQQKELPAVVIRDKSRQFQNQATDSSQIHNWNMSLELLIIADDKSTSEYLRKLMEDIFKAISTDTSLGGLVHDIIPAGDEFEVVQDGVVIADAAAMFDVLYRTTAWSS